MVNGNAVNCEQVWREISNYLEGDVNADLRAAMDDHFRTCRNCASVLAGTQNVMRLYGDDRMIEAPAGFGRRLEKRLSQDARSRRRSWSTWSAWLLAPAAALLLMAGGVRWVRSLTEARRVHSEQAQMEKNIPPEMIVVVAAGTKEFHKPDCDVIRGKEIARTMTAKEAIHEGYVPCLKCMRKYLQVTSDEPGTPELQIEAYADVVGKNSR